MNRLVASFAALFLVVSMFGGCGPQEIPSQGDSSSLGSQQEDSSSQPSSSDGEDEESEAPSVPQDSREGQDASSQPRTGGQQLTPLGEESEPGSDSKPSAERITVADASLYRGEVRGLDEYGFYLVQVPGRMYGDGIMRVSIDENTEFSFDKNTLKEGEYLEIYYNYVREIYPSQTTAIAVNRLMAADLCVFNGEVTQMSTKEDGTMDLLLKRIDGEGMDEILFHIGESTQVYVDTIEEGTKLSVFFSGAVTLSLPGQATALEVAPYAVTEAEDYTQWIGAKK